MRIEKDLIGTREIPDEALYGIHSLRAKENFPFFSPFPVEWYCAVGTVKLAVYQTIENFYLATEKKFGHKKVLHKVIKAEELKALIEVASEMAEGKYFEHFIVPGISGGAGTSINMNVNEILANTALLKTGKLRGDYTSIDPIEDANLYQSTNDVIPTSLKVAVIRLLEDLENSINNLRLQVETLEKEHRDTLRIAYTQMQEAVLSSYGRLFSTYNEALLRDWWRISRCFERIKTVNLGGSAVGTAITVPRYMVMETVKTLQKLTGLPITRAENLSDATSNLDSLVEVHATLKAHSVNLEKIVSDVRLLGSDLGPKEMTLPQKQPGSTIIPGKVNPVIVEFVVSAMHKVRANDVLIASLCSKGCLDLNAYIPAIGCAMLESIKLLIAANKTLLDNLFTGLLIHAEKAMKKVLNSPSITTALLAYIGYNTATRLALEMKESGSDIYQANETSTCG